MEQINTAAEQAAGVTTKPLKGEATPEQIAEWKKKYPQGIYQIASGDGVIYFRKPTRADLNYSRSKRDPEAQDEVFRTLAETTCIGGDEELLKDEQAMISICSYLEVMPVGKAISILNL